MMTTTLRPDADQRRCEMHGVDLVGSANDGVQVRWGLSEDEEKVSVLLELNGMSRRMAFEEQFIVAEKEGRVLAALRCRTEPKRLLLGLLLADPWADERALAVALYIGAGKLAWEMGVREVRARTERRADHPSEAGYRRRIGGWRLDVARAAEDHGPREGGER
jgi:hypothetical protein